MPTVQLKRGMAFSLNEQLTFYWWWQEMVAQLDDASMKFVVQGENGDDRVGIISCTVMLRPNSYDPSRHLDAVAAAKANAAKEGHQQPLYRVYKEDNNMKCSPCGTSSASAATAHLFCSARVAGRKPWTHSMPRGDKSKLNSRRRGLTQSRVKGRTAGTRTSKPKGH